MTLPIICICVILITALSSFIQRVAGIGLATVMMPLLLLFLNYQDSLLISGLIGFLGAFVLCIKQRRDIEWKKAIPPIIPYFIVGFFVTWFMMGIDTDPLKKWVGLCLFVLAIYLMATAKKQIMKGNLATGVTVGAISGVTNTLFNMAGPPMAIYFLGACKDPKAYMATMQLFLAVIAGYTNITRIASGMMYIGILPLTGLAIVGMLLGFFIGGKVFDKLDAKRLKTIVYIVIAATGLWLFISGWFS